ncbi:hypothetical protein [Marinomonas hwangdonensis]|nr:hypothetical protein [Marinomonas hwangdonensis]
MSKKTTPQENASNQTNPNKGTSGTNIAYDKVHGNRSKQISQNRNK